MEFVGKRFGRMVVVEPVNEKGSAFKCKCDCGREFTVKRLRLYGKTATQSCGCLRKERQRAVAKVIIANNRKNMHDVNMRYATNFQVIERVVPRKDNKTGCQGVWYNQKDGKYYAYLSLHKKRHSLGKFNTLADAVARRKEAERIYFEPVINEKNSTVIK